MTAATVHLEDVGPAPNPWRQRAARLIALAVTLWAAAAVALFVASERPAGSDRSGQRRTGTFVPGMPVVADRHFARLTGSTLRASIRAADLAAERASDPEVREFANRIGERHREDLAPISHWLAAWRAAEASGPHTDRVAALEGRSGPSFDRLFLATMVAQHRSLLSVAEAQIEEGGFEPARQIATALALDAGAELAQLRQLLQNTEPA